MRRSKILILLLFCPLLTFSQTDLENKIKKEFKINYELNILEDPISVRNLFLSNQNIVSSYITFVLNADRSWYFNYFNLNSMRRNGWNSYLEMYDNRFLSWYYWRENLLFSYGDYEWFKPRKKFFFGSDLLTELQFYNYTLVAENFYVKKQLLLLGKGKVELSDVGDLSNKQPKVSRDDILTVLTKNGKKYKVIPHPGKTKSWLNKNLKNKARQNASSLIVENRNSTYKNPVNSTNGYSTNNSSTTSASNVTRSVVSLGGSTSSNATNASSGGTTSVVSSGKKQ
tara:strand:+ start:2901 stop:3752 length:852 start_codon:yes stop_codon:yes gene_type:complete